MNLIAIIFLILVSACTTSNSPFGGKEKTEVKEVTLPDSAFTYIYTYKDSLKTLPNNTKIVLGNYKGADARILMKFTNFPRNTILTDDPIIRLVVNRKYNETVYDIKIALIDTSRVFIENQANWLTYNGSSLWNNPGGDYYEPFKTITCDFATTDTLSFTIDQNIVQNWIDEPSENTKNFGIIIFTENITDSFVEFSSREAGSNRPQMEIKFKRNEDAEEESQIITSRFDTFIHSMPEEPADSYTLTISNIPPRSIFFKIDLLPEYFDLQSENELKKINIVNATLILSVNTDSTHTTNNRFNLTPAIPKTFYDEIQQSFDDDDLLPYAQNSTISSINENDKMEISISIPMQVIISDLLENNGICILNNQNNMDFSHIQLYKNPKIRIFYSILKK